MSSPLGPRGDAVHSEGPTSRTAQDLGRLDFVLRLGFFLFAPLAIVVVAQLFPVRGALLDVGLGLVVFVAAQPARRLANKSRLVHWLLEQALHFEQYYRRRPPRAFAYYVAYPLLVPYWLLNREARQEFLVFRGYTLAGLALLVGTLGWQFFTMWLPELGWRDYWPVVVVALVVETLLVLAVLMPVATTVVAYHARRHHRRLLSLLLTGLLSTSAAVGHLALAKDPVVSWATRERVRLRTQAKPRQAHRALRKAATVAMLALFQTRTVDGEGRVDGEPLLRAHDALRDFYKEDEAAAFDLWASPRRAPRLVIVYFEARPGRAPIWVAIDRDGKELRRVSELPKGAFAAMQRVTDDDSPLWTWPAELELDLEEGGGDSGPGGLAGPKKM